MIDKNGAKQRAAAAALDVSLSTLHRGKDETRSRPRVKCRPPRSMYLNHDDLASAVAAPSGETLMKMTEAQLLALRRQASCHHSCTVVTDCACCHSYLE